MKPACLEPSEWVASPAPTMPSAAKVGAAKADVPTVSTGSFLSHVPPALAPTYHPHQTQAGATGGGGAFSAISAASAGVPISAASAAPAIRSVVMQPFLLLVAGVRIVVP